MLIQRREREERMAALKERIARMAIDRYQQIQPGTPLWRKIDDSLNDQILDFIRLEDGDGCVNQSELFRARMAAGMTPRRWDKGES